LVQRGFEESPQCSAASPFTRSSQPPGMVPIGSSSRPTRSALRSTRQRRHPVVATKANAASAYSGYACVTGALSTPRAITSEGCVRASHPARVDEGRPARGWHADAPASHRAKVSDPIRVAVGAGASVALEELSEIDRVDVAEAALAGWLQADGFVGQYTGTNRSLTIEFQVHGRRVRLGHGNLDVVFPDVHRKVRRRTPSTFASGASVSMARSSVISWTLGLLTGALRFVFPTVSSPPRTTSRGLSA